MKKRKALTLEDRKLIQEGISKSLSMNAIALSMGRSPRTISDEVGRNGGPEEYNYKKAQKRYEILLKKKKKIMEKYHFKKGQNGTEKTV